MNENDNSFPFITQTGIVPPTDFPNGIPTPTNVPPGIATPLPLQGGAQPYIGAPVNVPIYITVEDIRRIIREEISREFAKWEQKFREIS